MSARPRHISEIIQLVRSQNEFILSYAEERQIDPLTLRAWLLLQLPRLVMDDYFPNARDVANEAEILAEKINDLQKHYRKILAPPAEPMTLEDLEFVEIDADLAAIFHKHFHYVGSYRLGSHFALRHKRTGKIACMGSVANFDLAQVKRKIAGLVNFNAVQEYSRFIAFPWTPANSFSFFEKKLEQHLRRRRGIKILYSFINENMFDGRSHRAAGWKKFANEEGTEYMYLDGEYKTMRFFVDNYKTSDKEKLKEKLGARFHVANVILEPLSILINVIDRKDKNALSAIPKRPYVFIRPVIDLERETASSTSSIRRTYRTAQRQIGVPTAAIEHHDDFLPNIDERLLRVTQQYINFKGAAKKNEDKNVLGLFDVFSALGKDDLFTFGSGTESPFEFDPKNRILWKAVADALTRGATLCYLAPTKNYWKDYGKPNQPQIVGEFVEFAEQVQAHLPPFQTNLARTRLLLVQTADFPFFDVAGAKWDMFVSDRIKTPFGIQGRGVVPMGRGRQGEERHFIQHQDMAEVFFHHVTAAIHQKSWGDPGYIPSNVIEKLGNRAWAMRSAQPGMN